MTALQVVVNIVLGVVSYWIVAWLLGSTGLNAAAVQGLALIMAVVVFFSNSAARLGVR